MHVLMVCRQCRWSWQGTSTRAAARLQPARGERTAPPATAAALRSFTVLSGGLQIVKDHVVLVDDPQLQDGMQQRWPASAVAEHVASVVQRFQPEQVRLEAF